MTDPIGTLNTALAGRYRIERVLGQGGMATVYLAEDLRHERHVALKVMRPEVVAAFGADRFLREIKVTAKLNHPNVLALYDSGEAGDFLFYVMPFVDGESLRDRLKREKTIPLDEAVRIAGAVSAALDYAHAQGVAHRDIKPENILLQDGHPLVADFGVALALTAGASERLTNTGLAIGTLAYMSPEQTHGGVVDGRSDQYALACVLHEMVSGELPFGWSQPVPIAGPTSPGAISERRRAMRLPKQVDAAVKRALNVLPDDRYATMREFSSAIGAAPALRGAARKGPWYRRRFVPVAAATLLVAAGLAVWFAWPFVADPTPDETRYSGSVAVLYFDDQGTPGAGPRMGDALTEELISRLARIRRLRVVSPIDVLRYRNATKSPVEIAKDLGVDAILQGFVRSENGELLVSAQLLDGEHGFVMWTRTFETDVSRIFGLQDSITTAIVSGMSLELSRSERSAIHRAPTSELDAYQLFLRGQSHLTRWNAAGADSGVTLLRAALARDSSFADAHAQLAFAYLVKLYFGYARDPKLIDSIARHSARALAIEPTNETALLGAAAPNMLRLRAGEPLGIWNARQMIIAMNRLIERNPDSPTGNLGLAHYYLWVKRDSTKAKLLLRRSMSSVDAAVQGDPQNQFIRGVGAQASGMLALILEREGNTKGAIELTELSLQYSPGVSRTLSQLSRLYARAGDHERAIATSLQALRARSTAADSGSDYVNVGAQLYRAKRLDEARQAFADAYAKLDTIAGAERDYALLYWLALARRAGASAEAERSLRQRLDRKDAGWTTDLLAFSADRLSADALLDRARRAWQRCEAFYVIGARALAQGRPADARRYFASAVATQVTSYLEYDFARIELQLLDEQPARASPGGVGRR